MLRYASQEGVYARFTWIQTWLLTLTRSEKARFPSSTSPIRISYQSPRKRSLSGCRVTSYFFVSVPEFEGAWATGKTRQEALDGYVSVLREWLSAAVHFGEPHPLTPELVMPSMKYRWAKI